MASRSAARDAEALAYRARGWTYDRIANEMGYADRSAARKAVERALASDIRDSNEEARALLLIEYNQAKQAVWAVLEANHLVVSDGRVVHVDGAPLPDDDPVLRAVDRLVRINIEVAKICGAYAPVRSEVITMDAVEAEIRKLEAEVGSSGRGKAGAPSAPA